MPGLCSALSPGRFTSKWQWWGLGELLLFSSRVIKRKLVSPWQEHLFQVLCFPTSAGWVRSPSRSWQIVIGRDKKADESAAQLSRQDQHTRCILSAKKTLLFLLVWKCPFLHLLYTLLTDSPMLSRSQKHAWVPCQSSAVNKDSLVWTWVCGHVIPWT